MFMLILLYFNTFIRTTKRKIDLHKKNYTCNSSEFLQNLIFMPFLFVLIIHRYSDKTT